MFLKINNEKRNKHILLFLLFLCIIIIFNIFYFDNNTIANYSSRFYDSKYVCHDSISCNNNINLTKVDNINLKSKKYGFFSGIYNEEYLNGALVLGYSLRKNNDNNIPMYLIHLNNNKISEVNLCKLKKVGWNLFPVEPITVPSSNIREQFRNNYLKLHLWNLTSFNSIVYLDADTLVLKNIYEMFQLTDYMSYKPNIGFEFASTPDNYGMLSDNFNAGVFSLRPNINLYKQLINSYNDVDNYDVAWADQGFLNEFFRFRYLRLPETYNFNFEFWKRHKLIWRNLKNEMKVIHYTGIKPFLPKIFKHKNNINYKYYEPLEPWFNMYNEMELNIDFNC